MVIFACVATSMTPARRASSAISSSALVRRLACVVFAIGYLLQISILKGLRKLPRIRPQPCRADLPKRQQLVAVDVLALVLGERVEEHSPRSRPVGDQRAVAAGAALPAARDPLLDDAAAEIDVDQATPGALDRLSQATVSDSLTPRVAHQPFGFEDAHTPPNTINYSTQDYSLSSRESGIAVTVTP